MKKNLLGLICVTLGACSSTRTSQDPAADPTAARPAGPATEGTPTRAPVVLTDDALRIHRSAILVDGHNDLPWAIRQNAKSSFDNLDIAVPQPDLHTDIPRLREGGVGAQFWSVFVPSTIASPNFEVLRQIDLVERMAWRYPDTFELAYGTADIERIHAAGKIASLIGVEGGHAIENSLDRLRKLYAAGARYMTLTHADTLDWADSATDEAKSDGLSTFGEDVVRTMNGLGMLIDISHVSVETMKDALRVSRAPVIASHSSAFALAPHPRNVPDEVLELVAENGGVIMVNFFSGFVVPESARRTQGMFQVRRQMREQYPDDGEFRTALATWRRENPLQAGSVHDVVDHIEHIAAVAGIDHVGLGSDYDGVTLLPDQLEDVSCYPFITQELLNRGHSAEDIRKILGDNLLRAFREVEETARSGSAR